MLGMILTPPRSGHWYTSDELTFVRGLGCTDHGAPRDDLLRPPTPRRVLLQRYLEAMPLRHDWGEVDALKVRAVVLRLLLDDSAEPRRSVKSPRQTAQEARARLAARETLPREGPL